MRIYNKLFFSPYKICILPINQLSLMSNQVIDLKNTLVVDIETVSGYEKFEYLDEKMQQFWQVKAGNIKNEDELSPDELYFERAAIYAEFGKIVAIAIGVYYTTPKGEQGLRVKGFQGNDEREILEQFKKLLEEKFDQTKLKLCAHNGKEFDFPYLCRRMLIHGMSLPDVLNISGKKPWEVNHIDTLELWKFGDRKNYTSLDLLSSIFGISSSKVEMDGSKVNHAYYVEKDLEKIAEYCKKDVVVTASLYLKMNAMDSLKDENVIMV